MNSRRLLIIFQAKDLVCPTVSKCCRQEEAIQYLVEQAGKRFDPRLLNVFLFLVEKGENE